MAFDYDRACVLASQGRTMRQIAGELRCDVRQIYHELANSTIFEQRFTRARKEGLELLADDLITNSDDYADVQRAKLKSENVRWLLARRIPATYGDRLNVDVSHRIDLAAALRDANARLRPISDQRTGALVQDAEFKVLSGPAPADTESVPQPAAAPSIFD